jgi:hypothetical protein
MDTKNRFDLRSIVMTWTLITSTFTWTPTMRLLLKPEISNWNIFSVGGSGGSGQFWVLPLLATALLCLFYIEGRGRLRWLFHGLLLAWHLPVTLAFVYGSIWVGTGASFQGAMWGIDVPFAWLAPPFALFATLAIILVIRETRGTLPVQVFHWKQISWSKLGLATLLLPIAFAFFRMGEGFDTMVKIATVATILQWILLAEALGHRPGTSTKTEVPGTTSNRTEEGTI